MNKRILSLCLALVLLLSLLPAAAPTAAAAGDVAINETNFPDANFRRYVSKKRDSDGDGLLSPTEISDVTEIECSGCGIASLKGIEFFKALEYLYCYNNQLTSLDVSGCTALVYLDCGANQLTSLDVSKNTALEKMYCEGNKLTSLDVSKNTALKELSCCANQLTSLNVNGCTALETLDCVSNQLTSLDVSRNTALTVLSCYENQLTSLDVSRNTSLNVLDCGLNELTSLDVGKNTALKRLSCDGNQLTALDVSKNQALTFLACHGNKLAVLDVSAVPNLLDALKNGKKTVEDEFVQYRSEQGCILMDHDQNTIPTPPAVSAQNSFGDVKEKDYFYAPVMWAVSHEPQITAGTSKTKFSPSEDCTRAQVVTFLWRAAGAPEPKTATNPFQDVREKDYFYKAVLWAVENGITSGTSKTRFSPNESCTRAQVVTFLWRYEKQKAPKSAANPFKDVKADAYYYKAVLWAVENGVTSGTSKTKFSPDDTCTRGQIVTFLYRDLAGK